MRVSIRHKDGATSFPVSPETVVARNGNIVSVKNPSVVLSFADSDAAIAAYRQILKTLGVRVED